PFNGFHPRPCAYRSLFAPLHPPSVHWLCLTCPHLSRLTFELLQRFPPHPQLHLRIFLDAAGNNEIVEALKASGKKDHLRVDVTGDVQGDTLKVTSIKLL